MKRSSSYLPHDVDTNIRQLLSAHTNILLYHCTSKVECSTAQTVSCKFIVHYFYPIHSLIYFYTKLDCCSVLQPTTIVVQGGHLIWVKRNV